MGTVKFLVLPVFCSVMARRYRSPSFIMSFRRSFKMSEIRRPRLASSMRAVAIRLLGLLPEKPSRIVVMISLYCSRVSATVVLFKVTPPMWMKSSFYLAGEFVFRDIPRKSLGNTGFLCSYSWHYTNSPAGTGISLSSRCRG